MAILDRESNDYGFSRSGSISAVVSGNNSGESTLQEFDGSVVSCYRDIFG